ncbi:MAG: DEAD/DEAH box helicase [Flavobacteriaceae bacterium]|nr:DEAD/DEAH box helicase [Flavobacteriaceae bacterium]
MLNASNLHPYQKKAIAFIQEKKKCALFLSMGLGKSVSTLTALQSLKEQGKIKRALIIAPLRVANTVWAQEIEKWEHITLRAHICTGGAENRLRQLKQAGDIFIINRENVKWLIDLAKKKKKWPFDCVVIDESSSFKSPSSRRFKALKLALPKINYMVLLTGTPAPNGVMDLWSQLYLIDAGERLGKTITNFKNLYFNQTGYGGYTYQLIHGADQTIHEKISDICLSMTAQDYLDMPKRIDVNITCPMPEDARAQYDDLEKEFWVQLETGEIEVSSSAVMAGKLLQFCNGAVYDNEQDWHVTHDSKIEALKDIVADNAGENILVAYNFKSDLARLKKAFPDAVVLDRKGVCIPKWNEGKIKMMFAHPACLHPKTKVLTERRGWVNIIDVKIDDKVFDGVEFVNHDGCQSAGFQEVIDVFGIQMTKNHKLLIDNEWVEAQNVRNIRDAKRKALYKHKVDGSGAGKVPNLRGRFSKTSAKRPQVKPIKKKTLRHVYSRNVSQFNEYAHLENLEGNERKGNKRHQQGFYEIWRSRAGALQEVGEFRKLLPRYERRIFGRFDTGSDRQYQGVLKRKLQTKSYMMPLPEQSHSPSKLSKPVRQRALHFLDLVVLVL